MPPLAIHSSASLGFSRSFISNNESDDFSSPTFSISSMNAWSWTTLSKAVPHSEQSVSYALTMVLQTGHSNSSSIDSSSNLWLSIGSTYIIRRASLMDLAVLIPICRTLASSSTVDLVSLFRELKPALQRTSALSLPTPGIFMISWTSSSTYSPTTFLGLLRRSASGATSSKPSTAKLEPHDGHFLASGSTNAPHIGHPNFSPSGIMSWNEYVSWQSPHSRTIFAELSQTGHFSAS